MAGFFICGTDTDVGKTVATVLVGQALIDDGLPIDFYKPVQSGAQLIDQQLVAPDVELYKKVLAEGDKKRYTYLFKKSSSPHFAASFESKSIDVSELVKQLNLRSSGASYLLAEGAGGLYVPLTNDGVFLIDLIKESGLPAIIVARTGVGTINHTMLTVEVLRNRGIQIKGIIFSSTKKIDKEIEVDNIGMIEKLTKLPIIGTIPYIENIESKLGDKVFRSTIVNGWKIDKLKEGS